MAGRIDEVVHGAGLLVRGAGLVLRRPKLFGLGAVPPLITSVLLGAIVLVLAAESENIVTGLVPWLGGSDSGLAATLRALLQIALVAGAALLLVISFTALTLAIGSPIYDLISESVEAEFGPVPKLDEPVRVGIARAVRQSLALIAVSIPVAVALFGAGFIPVVGQSVVPAVSALFGGWMLAIELIGAPFERRGRLRLADRRAAMGRRRPLVLGFAVPVFLLLSIPFVAVVAFPAATAGGTLLARELLGQANRSGPDSPDG